MREPTKLTPEQRKKADKKRLSKFAERRKRLEKQFALEYAANGQNGTQAMLKVNKNMKPSSAAMLASRMMNKPEVKKQIELALEKHNLSYDRILEARAKMLNISLDNVEEMRFSPADVDRNLSGIQSILEKLEVKEKNTHTSMHLHLSSNSTHNEILQKRQELADFFNSIIGDSEIQEAEVIEDTE